MTDPIHGISQRVESLEHRFDDNINKINNRLDQIIDLMTKVTQLQEREVKNSEYISELKVNVREVNDSIKDWNHRIHDRMDRHFTEVQTLEDGLNVKIRDVESQNRLTREEFNKWFNRGIGAWTVASLLVIIVQSAGAYVIDGIIENNKMISQKIERLDSRLHTNEITVADLKRFDQNATDRVRDSASNLP